MVRALMGAADVVDDFLFDGRPGDLLLTTTNVSDANLNLVGRAGGHYIYQLD